MNSSLLTNAVTVWQSALPNKEILGRKVWHLDQQNNVKFSVQRGKEQKAKKKKGLGRKGFHIQKQLKAFPGEVFGIVGEAGGKSKN